MYRSYYMQVYSYTITIIKDQVLAEEITQNTFYKAMSSKKKFENNSSEITYLCSIAKRLAADEYRRLKKSTQLDEASQISDHNIFESAENKEIALKIHRVLHELKEPYKEVFQLRVFGELSFSEIGSIFNKSENWARVTYHRARLKIQERMDENG